MINLNTIYCCDAFEILTELENDSIDLVICDGPYGVTRHDWDKIDCIQEFNLKLIEIFASKLKNGGSLYLFGKHDCIDFIDYRPFLNLRSRIIWSQPSRLSQGRVKFTNSYDLICHFVKGNKPKTFNLDEIRVPQMVKPEHRRRCENVPSVLNGKYGKTKFNELGKNPGDLWCDIKQLSYKSKELVDRTVLNTVQKPEILFERMLKASSSVGDVVLDPFVGTGTVPVVCARLGRHFIGAERDDRLVEIARKRLCFSGFRERNHLDL